MEKSHFRWTTFRGQVKRGAQHMSPRRHVFAQFLSSDHNESADQLTQRTCACLVHADTMETTAGFGGAVR